LTLATVAGGQGREQDAALEMPGLSAFGHFFGPMAVMPSPPTMPPSPVWSVPCCWNKTKIGPGSAHDI